MSRRALFFPYIRVPDDIWFNRLLLYWDSVGTIVPGGLEADQRFVTPRMLELQKSGLLEFVNPVAELWQVQDIRKPFLEYLDADGAVQQLRATDAPRDYVHVHLFKLGDLASDLVDRGLAQYSGGEGWELWCDVERRTAELFMAYLAATLALLDQTKMEPVTNEISSMAALVGADARTSMTLQHARQHRIAVLDDLLPAPDTSVPAAEIVDFKTKNHAALVAFRNAVDAAVLDVAKESDVDLAEERMRITRSELIRERDAMCELMGQRRWPALAFGSIAGLAGASGAVVGAMAENRLLAAALQLPGVLSAAYVLVRSLGERPDITSRPMAYAALADRQFARN